MKGCNSIRSLEKWKKIVLVLVGIVFLIRIFYIGILGELDKAYYTSCLYDLAEANSIPCLDISETFYATHDRLDSLELLFTGMADDRAGTILVCIYSEDELLYKSKVTLANFDNLEWKKIFVNAPLRVGEKYRITVDANDDCTKIPDVLVLKTGYAPEIIETLSNKNIVDGNVVINFGYLQFPGLADRFVMISLWVLLYALIYIVIVNIENILNGVSSTKKAMLANKNVKEILYVLELLLCIVFLNCSGIEFQEMTKITYYVISFVSIINYDKKKEYISEIINNSWKKYVLTVLYVYAAFALVGQRILIYPLTLKPTIQGIFVFSCTVVWFIPVINSFLFYLDKAAKSAFGRKAIDKKWKFIVLNVAVLLLPAAYNLFANNPGIATTDTFECMITSAQHLNGMYDWHPAFYCMVLRLIEEVWNSTYAVIAVQHFFWAYVFIELFLYLRDKGISDGVLIASSLFCGLNVSNFIHINTIWKDIPYTLSLLWMLIIIAKLSFDFNEYKSKWYIYFELIVAFVGVFFYRKNGIVSFVIVALAVLFFLRENKKLLVSVLISVMCVGIIKGPVYSYFNVKDQGVGGMYHGLGLDILGAYYSGGEVSENTIQMINMMTSFTNAEFEYNPTWSNQSYSVNVDPRIFVINYIDTFIRNPLTMARAIIDREDFIWDIYAGQDSVLGCVAFFGTIDGYGEWNDYYDERVYRSLYSEMAEATLNSASIQWIAAIEWRSGIFCLIGLICIVWLIIRYGKGKYLVVVSPIFGHIMSLLLSTGWSDFRYVWPLNLMNFSLILLTIVYAHHREYEKR